MAKNYGYYHSPIGLLEVIGGQEIIKISLIENVGNRNLSLDSSNNPIVSKCIKQLQQYFEEQLQTFDIPLVIRGTEFQELVWNEVAKIPYGEAISYQEIAKRINRPNALRAVGTAVGKNPIPIIIPCHRVVRAGKSKIIRFGWGKERKIFLQNLEQKKN
ncbi:methylated-DNA--[protein]-cysteine S-methyltransferase [Spiroplasma platyhelix]|uniref:methylated-DNA--[protein]-cysteine S-methyltransferase n=1 Tax=Spiroplasma platyhelix PALS-1 TaxID=1276218 RepID=A0A846TWS5_9MOLU|nr:methylated-DNA--[protein]-cysteine S-methyltransferase [Spiroplasma platyhelix]MBE4704269.1 Methylated-DNA--protein-cysteine methyltransferase [Spiroplasma platyhelix PALS-1]NKE38642.1 methylated-DNA--[protein]-cysteine S-methyltransferase [Spiroplasma platyhelix PALS-1]UJB28853.1 methylated-DNA-[protein]-cysteine S-methyltransferase [Spiroplasma platyhelix PALS-1]